MNKKVSTLLTVALTLGGSLLSSSAFAEVLKLADSQATSVEANKNYLFVQHFSGQGMYAYAFELQADGTFKQVVKKIDIVDGKKTLDVGDNTKGFLWNVKQSSSSEISGSYVTYTFNNQSSGSFLSVDQASKQVIINPEAGDKVYKEFAWNAWDAYNGGDRDLRLAADPNNIVQLNSDGTLSFVQTASLGNYVYLYEVESEDVNSGALNELYNSKGFSFAINTGVAGKAVEENLFQNVRAIDLTETVNAVEDGQRWGFPEGTYFVTKASYEAAKKAKGDYDKTWENERKLEFLRSLTFIAVSSTETVEATGVDRGNGQGFELVEISGDKLYDYIGTDLTKKPQNDQVSVFNACFTVKGLSTNAFPYSIKVKDFYYVADADALASKQEKGENYAQTKKEVNLTVLDHGTPKAYYLTTTAGTTGAAEFIFKFDQSNVEKGMSFLKSNGPAVYNIRFVSGADDKTERGKYLTLGLIDNTSNIKSVAKGEALADIEDLATPAYQFVITSVKDNDVTFTNRETGTSFTVKLYKEREENGKKIYSLSAVNCADWEISIVNIKSNSYGTEIADKTVKFNDVEIELIESPVDVNAGYLNVEDGTLMTMKFARDAYSTSNFWYAAVAPNSNGYSLWKGNDAILSDDLYSAAQWKLVKADSVDLDRDYAYINNGVVATKGYGDKLKAYLYKFNYVVDGDATKYYLNSSTTNLNLSETASKYIVRKNPDGSVSLVEYSLSNAPFDNKGKAFAYNVDETVLNLRNDGSAFYSNKDMYKAERKDSDLLTFLVNESPEISWKAEEGHVTIQAEGGDYLTMAEDNDAIIVNENEADKLYLHVDKKGNGVIPSFYISKGYVKGSNAESERMFLYNPIDSVEYQVNMDYDPRYQLGKGATKAVFKSGKLNETRDTLSLTVKGEVAKKVAMKSNNQQNVWGGLNRFQFQIVETEEGDATYYIRQPKANKEANKTLYLANANDKAVWVEKDNGTLPPYTFVLEDTEAPTSNEGVAASEVKVVAQDGAVVVKNAAGKNVVVSTILGQVVANEVLTSDNATINVPAGIVVVAVEGESFKVNVK